MHANRDPQFDPARSEPAPALSAPGGLAGALLWWVLGLFAVGVGLAAALAWGLGMEVTVQGKGTVAPQTRSQVKAELGGIVRQVRVRTGQAVHCGDSVIFLDARDWLTELRKVEHELAAGADRARHLEEQLAHEAVLRAGELESTRLELAQVEVELERLRAELAVPADSPLLASGWTRLPLDELLPVRRQQAQVARGRAEVAMAEARLAAVSQGQRELAALTEERARLIQDRDLLRERLHRAVVRAPVDGTVLTSEPELRVGDQVQAGESLLELVQGTAWRAEVAVGEGEVSKVRPGQEARVQVAAFPRLEYGSFTGIVESVAREPRPAGDGYAVRIRLREAEVRDGNRRYGLACGMTAEARILVERGRIAILLWRRLLRGLGKLGPLGIYPGGSAP
ncbi:MAG: HlyD family efflux transporter periplasmic adaptor subunit [Candidatus Latescibacterota bacterium]|jgi:multidrug resistance efflux pump